MAIGIFAVKIIIIMLIEILMIKTLINKDTSELQRLMRSEPTIIKKFINYIGIGGIEGKLKKLSIPFNLLTVLTICLIGIVAFIIVFAISKMVFPLNTVAYIVAIPFLFTGFAIIKVLAEKQQLKLEEGLSDFFIQLKAALRINSDIIEGLRKIQNNVLEPFSTYTKQMLNEINAGKLPEAALYDFANKIGIKKFSFYINNVRYCHIYGGDIAALTSSTHSIICESIKQKKKRSKETKSICLVLYSLMIIDIYMYFCFISANTYYLNLMTESFIGQVIINTNFICMWIMIWLSRIVKKLDY